MQIANEIARDMLVSGCVYEIKGEHIGIRAVRRAWFNYGSGHYVADVGSMFVWSDGPNGPWHPVPRTTTCERRSTL